jgi:RNA polymerase sigma-70 factor, ECF subfamily
MMGFASKQPTLLPTADALGDAELVGRALRGDRWSRDMLYRRHAHYLLAIACRLLASRSEGEEVVQDTFVVGFEQLGALRDPAAVRGWLAQIAVSLVRRRLRRGRLLRLLGLDHDHDATLAGLAAPTLRPDDRAELALIDRVLRRMPANLRIAWMLRKVEGLALPEVASACSCSLATVKRRIAAADAEMAHHVSFPEPLQ